MDADLPIDDRVVIPRADLSWAASRSGGPGGQHVNTTDSRVRLTFALSCCAALSESVKERLRAAQRAWLTSDGDLILSCDTYRSQHRNLEEARGRLAQAIRAVLKPPKPRRPTRPSRAAKRRRLDKKKARSVIQKSRGRVRRED